MKKITAFSLAEILLALGIMGVVAVMAIPSIVTDVREHTFKTQKQAFILRTREAVINTIMKSGSLTGPVDTQEFVKNLSQVMPIAKICDSNEIKKCGMITDEYEYSAPGGQEYAQIPMQFDQFVDADNNKTKPNALVNGSGASMLVWYNKRCDGDVPCLNIIYDVNGSSSPNMVGRDVGFMTVYKPRSPKFGAPLLFDYAPVNSVQKQEAAKVCHEKYSTKGDIGLPTKEEALAIKLNSKMMALPENAEVINAKSGNTDSGYLVCVGR